MAPSASIARQPANHGRIQRRSVIHSLKVYRRMSVSSSEHRYYVGRSELLSGPAILGRRERLALLFSNRPFRVKRFQTIHDSGVNVARGLALLSGLGTKALPSWVSKTRWNNLSGDLAVNVTAGSSGRTNSPHPSSREGHHSTARWSSSVLIGLDAA